MFSWGIKIFASDTHAIYSSENKKLLNWGKEIIIGNHVWICMDATILKNSRIPPNSIVGASAVVAGNFQEENSILAGNPARVVKRQVHWDPMRPKDYKQGLK